MKHNEGEKISINSSQKESKLNDNSMNQKLDCSKIYMYRKPLYGQIVVMEIDEDHVRLHKGGLNNFEKKVTKLDKDKYKYKIKINPEEIKKNYCDPSRLKLTRATSSEILGKNQHQGAKIYYTLYYEMKPFLISIKKKQVDIYTQFSKKYYVHVKNYTFDKKIKISSIVDNPKSWMYINKILTFNPTEIFIGKSPLSCMTTILNHRCYGEKYDGNSILLHLNNNEYVCVGKNIIKFKALSPIVKYFSPVRAEYISYPYAIDKDNRYYLINQNVIIKIPKKYSYDPFIYYNFLIKIVNNTHPTIIKKFQNIKEFFRGRFRSNLEYHPDPSAMYDYYIEQYKDLFILKNDQKIKLTKEDYIKLNNDYGKKVGIEPLIYKEVSYKEKY